MKKILIALATCVGLTFSAHSAVVKIVVPFGPGGSADYAARQVERILTNKTGYTYVVENHPGAGGQIGAQLVAKNTKAETVLLVHSLAVIINSIGDQSTYSMKEFKPVSGLGSIQWALVTHPQSHVNTLSKLMTTPDPVFFGSSGVGTSNQIAGELLKQSTKRNMIHVPFKGESAAFTEILGNRLSVLFVSTGLAVGHNVTPLAVTGPTRSTDFPNVPTFQELGISGFDINPNWLVLLASPGSDPAIVKQIQKTLSVALQEPAEVNAFKKAGINIDRQQLLNVDHFLHNEQAKMKELLKNISIR